MGLSPSFLRRTAMGMELPLAAKGKVLICLFQRGAADALNVVVPHGERAYYTLRPTIAIPTPLREQAQRAQSIWNGFFGLHPSLAPLKTDLGFGDARSDSCCWEPEHERARTSTRRIIWKAARRTPRARATAGSTGISRRRARASSARQRRFARSR